MSEKDYRVLTASGPDRPGLVKEISAWLKRNGANLEDSRMAILGGEFALLVLVSGPSQALAELDKSSEELQTRLDLLLTLKATAPPASPAQFLPYHLHVSGVDRPGIVHTVTGLLAALQINVASLESRVVYAPLSGTPMFVLDVDLQVPTELTLSAVRRELAQACEEENLDFSLEARR